MEAVVILLGWVFGVCLHEYAHALAAWHGGDTTVEEKGYLDFNPLIYFRTDLILSLVLPVVFLLLGAVPLMGAAVLVDFTRLRTRHWEAAVSAAGPAANLVLVLLLSAPFALGWMDPTHGLVQAAACLAMLNLYAVLLNLLPIPGLDGYGILDPYLPREVRAVAAELRPYGVFVMFGVVSIPAVGRLLLEGVVRGIDLLGIPVLTALQGFAHLDVFRIRL
jgi:Zn-dependent protease